MKFKQLISKLIDKTIYEINQEENIIKINNKIINPITQKIINKVYPYFIYTTITVTIILLSTLIIASIILYFILCKNT